MKLKMKHFVILFLYFLSIRADKDYYELLGVPRTADVKEIRKAFKKLAVTLHPDKNQDNSEAHETFIQLTRAYEVLKDDEKRKHYDVFGDDKDRDKQQKYHSYTYYRDQFGIYDDDPEIITLSHSDFESSVEDGETEWFINFYSPLCSHCHTLAPVWRRLAKSLQDVLTFGAVNCEDDWSLCRRLGISSYPTLLFYPASKTVDTQEKLYRGRRDFEEMRDYVLHQIETSVVYIESEETWKIKKKLASKWLLILHDDSSVPREALMLSAMLRGLVEVGVLDCKVDHLCSEFEGLNIVYMDQGEPRQVTPVTQSDPHDVMEEILNLLPAPTELNEEAFTDLLMQLELGSLTPWLILFYLGSSVDQHLEVKKLTALLPNFNIGVMHCGRNAAVCSDLGISRYPVLGVAKRGGGVELHHGLGTDISQLVARWARESALAANLVSLAPNHFDQRVLHSGGAWLVEFFSPYCPPCIKMLNQVRKAALDVERDVVRLATVDCTAHRHFCSRFQVNQYPTLLLFNGTQAPTKYRGAHSAAALVEFINNIVNTSVISLNDNNFMSQVGSKTVDEMWMVDFFAPWCGPCQQLAPEYRKLAKMVKDIPNVYIGEVDCDEEKGLCGEQGVQSYPHIRLYPPGSVGLSRVAVYSSWSRDAASLRRWLYQFIKSPVVQLNLETFSQLVVGSSRPWLIDFYAPWCGHCVTFEPEFITIAQKLEGQVRTGKVNCDEERALCARVGVAGYPSVIFFRPHSEYRGIEIHSQSPSIILSHVAQLSSSHNPRDEL